MCQELVSYTIRYGRTYRIACESMSVRIVVSRALTLGPRARISSLRQPLAVSHHPVATVREVTGFEREL